MIPPLDPSQLCVPAQKILSSSAPPKLQLMAAKGIVPGVRPDEILTVMVLLSESDTPEVAETARSSLAALPAPLLQGALQLDLPEAVILVLAQAYTLRMDVLEGLVKMPRLPVEAVMHLAQYGDEVVTELVATNQELLLQNPQIIEQLYLNKATRMSTTDRLVELSVRNGIELQGIAAWKEVAQAIQGELIAEPSDEPLPEDEDFWETDDLAHELTHAGLQDAFFEDDEGQELLEDKLKPLHTRISDMSVSQKIRRAMLGTKEERLMLIREQNKMVASAAARSPLLQESDVVQITRNRGVSIDVLRIIGMSAEWMKSYSVKKNLVENAKTPIAIAQRLITQLRESDLRRIAKSKNVPSAVRTQAQRHLDRRKH
ncbi:MAG: hypothetical protein DRI90_21810 [Deltaproteobacteria bacterium]|nr:MAG: hypothetical protein DRI90_21810 [Deltaproteobacteria bacterium]